MTKQYLELCQDIIDNGTLFPNRTGVDTLAIFGRMMRFSLADDRIPLLTTKKVYHKGIIHELLWMLSGDTNIRYLKANNVNIWDSWIDPKTAEYKDGKLVAGELNKIYQHQWRRWADQRLIQPQEWPKYRDMGFTIYDETLGGQFVIGRKIDQIQKIIDQLKKSPESRRIILSAWNVAEIEEMSLPPCHWACQFHAEPLSLEDRLATYDGWQTDIIDLVGKDQVEEVLNNKNVPKYRLSCMLQLRSNDTPLGNPFNIVQYSLLTKMFAQCANMIPHEFIYVGGNVHHYVDQLDGIREQLQREPRQLPKMKLNPNKKDIFSFTIDDFTLEEYDPHPAIKFPQAAV